MDIFFLTLFTGVCVGFIYGLIAFSLTAVYNVCGVLNFVQGECFMGGAAIGFFLMTQLDLPFSLTLLVILVATGILGFLTNYVLVSPLLGRRTPLITVIVATIGATMLISGGIGGITEWRWMPVHPLISGAWHLGSLTIMPSYVVIILTAVVVVTGYWLFENKTIYGMALRATGINRAMAELVGIQVPSMIALAFVIGSIIAGITGIVVAPVITPHPIMGMHYLLLGFISAVVGGLGNAYGSMIGGLILGLLGIVISSYVFPVYADIATFVLLLIVLVARPKGLFAR